MNVGKSIKRGMLEKNVTRAEIISTFGITRQTLSAWINNKTTPTMTIIQFLAEYFGVKVSEFIAWGE